MFHLEMNCGKEEKIRIFRLHQGPLREAIPFVALWISDG